MALLARATGGSEKAAVTKWRHCLHIVRVELVASFVCRCFIRHVVRVLLIIVVVAAVFNVTANWFGFALYCCEC